MLPRLPALLILFLSSGGAFAEQINVAVASNFTPTLRLLATAYETQSGHQLRISSASTGKLFAQITYGAPFDIFLAADAVRPHRLEQMDKIVPGSRFTYSQGALVLWGPAIKSTDAAIDLLQSAELKHIAIANPKTAPYGAATQDALQSMGLWQTIQGRLVRGENIAQAYQYVASGVAPLGFVARSQLVNTQVDPGYVWNVPERYYRPIRQQAVLLRNTEMKPAARDFINYLQSSKAQKIILDNGYRLEEPSS